jgi:hypothetical protein
MAEEIIKEEILPVETVTYGDPKPKPKNYLTKIHENLVDTFGVKEVPDEVTFIKKMKDPNYAKLIHENLVDAYGTNEVPDFKSFSDKLTIVSPEKKNLGATIGDGSVPLKSELSSIQKTEPFDKNANPVALSRQAHDFKQPEIKGEVALDMSGMPVESSTEYNPDKIKVADDIEKHLDKLGFPKDFRQSLQRIRELPNKNYIDPNEGAYGNDDQVAAEYKENPDYFTKKIHRTLWQENLANNFDNLANQWIKTEGKENEAKNVEEYQGIGQKLNNIATQIFDNNDTLQNRQYYVKQASDAIKQYIRDPKEQKQALDDLAISTADVFGSLGELEEAAKNPISKNLNDYQTVALNYLEQIDSEKASFYKKYLNTDPDKLKEFQYKGYEQLQKELEEIGLNLFLNNSKTRLKQLSDMAQQQGGQLDPEDYQEYNKLLENTNLADARLSKLGLLYPNTADLDTRSIAQELTGGGSSAFGLFGKNLGYGLAKTGKSVVDIALSPFRSEQMNDNAALEALGIENYVSSKTIPSRNQSALVRDLPKITPELDARIKSIKDDKNLSQDEKTDQVDQLLQSNRDKWTPASAETSWNLGPTAIISSVANTGAKLAPFLALEFLTQGSATPSLVASFAKMYGNVLVTSYSEELAKAMQEKKSNPELTAYGNVLVNSLAFKAAGVGDIVKNIRGAASKAGGITEKIISKLDDKAILSAIENPNLNLKTFLNTLKEQAVKGVKTAATFESVLGAVDIARGAEVNEEFVKQKALNLLTFSIFNTALGTGIGMSQIGKENKEALFLAATNKDEVLYEAEKAFANKQITPSDYNQIKQNVEAASKVLERVPMVNGKGEKLNKKEATELFWLKIQEQNIEDQIKKDLPKDVQDKITKDLANVQDKIDKVYKGTLIEDIGKPFAGLKDREEKRKIKIEEDIESPKEPSGLTETKPVEIKIGDNVQWTSQGADQFNEPKKVISISEDGNFAFVEGSNTGIPVQELSSTEVKPAEEIVSPTVSEFKLGYAPFREGKITDISQADKAFENKNYQAWKKMASTFAQNIGLEVFSEPNVVGKYGATSELGEASSTPVVKGTDKQVELFAALMGTLAPEGQHSVMINKYDLKGKDLEHIYTFANKEAAQDFYKNAGQYGVQDLSLTPDSNSVMFITSDKRGFDINKIHEDYGTNITGIEEKNINTRFLSQGEYSRILEEQGNKSGEYDSPEYRQNILDAIQLAKERARRFSSDYDQKSEQAKIEAEKASQDYIDKNKKELGLPDTEKTSVKKVDPELSKRIKDAYDALPVDDSNNPEVKAAYEKAAKEIDKQFEYLTKDLGIKVEFIKDDPYKNSDEMFEDVINNKRLKVYQGGEPHPFLGESTIDANGFTANEKLRAIHDYFGHFVNRNQFGKIGEEAAWVDHSKMFSPEAQRAITTETRGQNSWVNFSGVNDAAIAKMQKGNQLIKEGNVTEGNKLIQEGQSEFKFAEQKVALMPVELSDWTKYSEKPKPLETAPKIEEPVIEEIKPSKTPQQVQISKKALGDNYNFSKDFDVRGGDVVATDVLTEVTKRAEQNGVDVPTQRAIEVNLMSKGTPEPTEFNIVTAGSHLLSIDAKIAKAQEGGNLAEVESLNEQRNEVLSVLRTLGNKAGRNLGLFNLVFQETDRSEVKLTRDYLKKVLNVEDVPETIAELDKSNLTAEQKKTVRPYVEKIEKAKANFDAIEKEVTKNISKLNDDEVNAAIEKARAEGKKEGFEEGMKSNTSEEKQKRSKKIKDLASQIRRSDELDKFLKGAGPLGNVEKAGFVDLGTYKEIVANVLDAVAKAVELGENVTEAIKKAVDKFKDVDAARLISDVKTIMSKAELPNRKDVMDKISKIAKAESANDITKTISDKGLIKDIVNSYLGEDLTNDQVLFEATYDLKSILPNVTREQVADAYAERGQFKKETKAKIENEINQKKADVKRLAIKEARLKALEAADDYHLEETKEGKKRVTSEYEKELDEKIKNLLKEKNNVEKQQKVSKTPKTEQDKIDEINKEIKFVKETKSVYDQAIKDPKKASEALIQARAERDKTYSELGLKLEKNAKAPILVERNYQTALAEIENDSNLYSFERDAKIAELKAQRDLDLQGTKQGVVSSLSDDINNLVESNFENADLNDSLKGILKDLAPTGEKLDDQINKSYNKLNKLVKDENLTREEKEAIKEIVTDLENNNQLTSDELASKRLKKQWENEIRKAETDIASGNFTKLPSNTYDYRRNDELVRLNKARENKTGQLNRMVADAKEKTRTTAEKALDLSTKFLVSGVHTAAKVAEAATFKPFMDSMVDLTAGRVASYITGAPYTSLYSVKKGYKTFAAFKNKEEAQKYIQKLQDKRDIALENLKDAHENGGDIKKADKEFKKADLEYAVSTLYNSIESNVLNSFWQYMKHGATDYDVSIGKSSKKDIADYRTVLGKTGYVLDGWIRMHSAMKSSLSARPEMMKVFSSTLKDFQRKGMELSPENISTAMVLAADAYEAGRLTNKTALSKIISRGKGSEKSAVMRLITKGVMPVSTIAVNLAKRGIDYSTLGTEGFVRLANETKKGMRLNEVEGKTYDSLMGAIKDGWNRIPLKERAYINGVIGRGLFGSAIMLATMYGLKNGMIKYGGTFEDQKKRKIMGSDDEQLKAGEWEFFGKRLPKAASLFLNHLPEFLAVSLIADNYQINQMGGTGGEKFETTIDEVEARLPFQTMAGLFVPGRRVNTLVDRFTRIPIAAEAAGLLDEKAEFRDKSDFINRIRGNVGFGIVNPTKEQQKQIDAIKKQLRKLPSGTLTPEDEKDIDAIIEEIKNTDFGELEIKKAMEESKKE